MFWSTLTCSTFCHWAHHQAWQTGACNWRNCWKTKRDTFKNTPRMDNILLKMNPVFVANIPTAVHIKQAAVCLHWEGSNDSTFAWRLFGWSCCELNWNSHINSKLNRNCNANSKLNWNCHINSELKWNCHINSELKWNCHINSELKWNWHINSALNWNCHNLLILNLTETVIVTLNWTETTLKLYIFKVKSPRL